MIIVGSGATGSWAARELTAQGVSVLLLEAGDSQVAPVETGPRTVDEIREFRRRYDRWRERQQTQSQCYACTPRTSHLFVDDVDHPYSTADGMPFYWIRGHQLGGRLWTWAGYAYRMSDSEFKAASRDGVGVDWPISYRDLAPYYDRIEQFLQVTGTAESIPHLPDGRFHHATALTRGEKRLKHAVENRWSGRSVIPGRCVSVTGPFAGTDSLLADLGATGLLTIRTKAVASQIITDTASGKAAGIAFVDRETGEQREAWSRAVLLCASTIESTRLLLNSASKRHPNGFANSSGLVGSFLMDHLQVKITGNATMDAGDGIASDNPGGIYIPQFRNTTTRDTRFARGYGIQGSVGARASKSGLYPFWMAAFGEMLPRPENRVSVSSRTKDAWGIPVPHVECTHGSNEAAMADDIRATLREMAEAAGFEIGEESSTLGRPGLCVHESGTARMGDDRRKSVLNPFNQSWDAPNLFITDGSCFVSQGCQNPTLTMMALTARACEYLAGELRKGTI